LVSACIVGHLTLLAVSAIPNDGELALTTGTRGSDDDRISSVAEPVLEGVQSVVDKARGIVRKISAPLRPLAALYANRLGLTQRWNMFANPPGGTEYFRLTYFWTNSESGGAIMTTSELIFPKAAEDESRLIRAFWDSHRDKAISNAFGSYFDERSNRSHRGAPADVPNEALARNLGAVVESFSQRFRERHPGPPIRLLRVEGWYGWSESPSRGERRAAPQSHANAVARFREVSRESTIAALPADPVLTARTESDIVWNLIYIWRVES
jgi:hypothetical protein